MLTPENSELSKDFVTSRDKCLTLIHDILENFGQKGIYGRFASLQIKPKPHEHIQYEKIRVIIEQNRVQITELRSEGKVDTFNYEDYDFFEDGRVKLTTKKEKRNNANTLNTEEKEKPKVRFLENPQDMESLSRKLDIYKRIFEARKVRQDNVTTKK